MRKRWLFWVAVLLQLLVLTGLTVSRSYTLATGQVVRLETAPVDPRDHFRGDYVRLGYTISTLHPRELGAAEENWVSGEEVWVLLRPDAGGYWQAVAVGRERRAAAEDAVALRGRVQFYAEYDDRLNLTYGIESFFVPEGEGRPLERPELQMDVEAAVDRFGRAAIARVLVDGQEVRFRPQ